MLARRGCPIASLMESLSALRKSPPLGDGDQALAERHHRLMRWIAGTPTREFVPALLQQPPTLDAIEIAQRAKLVAWRRPRRSR